MKRIFFIGLLLFSQSYLLYSQSAIPKDEENIANPGMILTSGAGNAGSDNSEGQSVQGGLKNFVNMQTGALVHNVPLGTVSGYQLSVPVSLSYYSNGIKVNQESLPVGLGWSLSAGGTISRKLKGLPDEHENGFLNTTDEILGFDALNEDQKKQYINDVLDKKKDSQADIFQLSLPGVNGYFSFDNLGNIVTYPKQNLSITYVKVYDRIVQFKILTQDGIEYTFGDYTERSVEQLKHNGLSVPLKTNDKEKRIPVFNAGYTQDGEIGDVYHKGEEPDQNVDWEMEIVELKNRRIDEFYDKVDEPEIDYENIKEELGELYNSKWYLTKIKHPSGDNIILNYEKLSSKNIAEMPIVTKSYFDEYINNAQYNPTLTLDDPHYTLFNSAMIYSPKYFFKEYQYTNPDFSEITTTTGEDYYNIVSPTYCNRMLYFSPSNNYNLRLTEIRNVRLTEIITTNGQKAVFLYEDLSNFQSVLRRVEFYTKNELLAEYILDNDLVTSSHLTSSNYNSYNLIEALVAQEIYLLSTSELTNVNSLNNHEVSFKNEILKKYVLEGIKPELYDRLILNRIVVNTGEGTQILNEFTYKEPEKLPRRNSLMKNIMGYPLYENAYANNTSSLVVNDFDLIIPSIDPLDAADEYNYNPMYGILTEIKNEAGGFVKFIFDREFGARLKNVLQYSGMEIGEDPISIWITHPESIFSSIYAPIKPVSSYSYIFYSTDLRDNSNYYLKGNIEASEYMNDISWFDNDIYAYSTCVINYNGNGREKFYFTTTEDLGNINSENKVHFIPAELFKDQYNVETGVFGVSNNLSVIDEYNYYPFANIKSYGFAIGNVKEHQVYIEDSFYPVTKTLYTYDYKTDPAVISSTKSIINNKLMRGYDLIYDCNFPGWCFGIKWYMLKAGEDRYRAGVYNLKSFSYHLKEVTKYDIDPITNEEIITVSENKINENTLMNRRRITELPNNEGEIHSLTLYAADFSSNSGFIGALKDKNLKNLPIEQVTYKVDAQGNTKILSAQHIVYDDSNPLQIKEQYHLELDEPMDLAEFKFANALSQGEIPSDNLIGVYLKYWNYVKTNIETKYDGLNRVFASKGEDEIWNGTIMDMYGNSPVAEIVNQELTLTEVTPDPINELVAGAALLTELEHRLVIPVIVNKKQVVSVNIEFANLGGDSFYFELLINGKKEKSGALMENNSYTFDLSPGAYEFEFFTRNEDVNQNQNNYEKSMNISYVEDLYNAYFSSFEEDGVSSADARTGSKYYYGTFDIPVSISDPSNFVMSYWYLSGSEWEYSGELSFQQSLSIGAPIDDLKVYKKGGMMKGYVYDVKGRLVAEIDANENRVLNEYDEFNRLKIVRNTDEDIVRKYEYQIIHP